MYIIDNRKNELWNNVYHEIVAYHWLKEVWGKGHIRFQVEPGTLKGPTGNIRGSNKHLVILGCYVDSENKKTEVFWGFNIRYAHREIKSFL